MKLFAMIAYNLPKRAYLSMSWEQLTYIDEFTFQTPDPPDMWENGLVPKGTILAFYGEDLLAVWNGNGWTEPL